MRYVEELQKSQNTKDIAVLSPKRRKVKHISINNIMETKN